MKNVNFDEKSKEVPVENFKRYLTVRREVANMNGIVLPEFEYAGESKAIDMEDFMDYLMVERALAIEPVQPEIANAALGHLMDYHMVRKTLENMNEPVDPEPANVAENAENDFTSDDWYHRMLNDVYDAMFAMNDVLIMVDKMWGDR